MKVNKLFILSLFLLTILTIGVVSAQDNIIQDTNQPLSIDEASNEVVGDENQTEEVDDFPSEIEISPSSEVAKGNPLHFTETINDGIREVRIDDNVVEAKYLDSDEVDAAYEISTEGLALGNHSLDFKITNGTRYPDTIRNFTFCIQNIVVNVPKKVVINDIAGLTVELPSDAQGNVVVLIDEEEIYNGNEQNIYISLDDKLNAPQKGYVHKITINYTGDEQNGYPSYFEIFNVTARYNIDIKNETFFYGEKNQYEIYVPDALSKKKLTVKIDGVKYNITENWAGYLVDVSGLDLGNHTVVVSYSGDNNFYANKATANIEIVTGITTPTCDWIYGWDYEGYAISLTLPSNAKGKLSVYVDNKLFKSTKLVKGFASISMSGVKPGSHKISASYSGSDYKVKSKKLSVNVTLNCYILDCKVNEAPDVTFYAPKDVKGNLTILVNGKNYTAEVINGTVKISINPFSKVGNYKYKVTYSEDKLLYKSYNWVRVSPQITLPSKVTNGKGSIVVKSPGANANISVLAKSSTDSYKFSVKSTKGEATISLAKLNAGSYKIYVEYNAKNLYESATGSVKVTNAKLAANNLTKYYGSSSTFKVQVKDSKGKIVKSKYVKFYRDGKYVTKVKTNKNGWASLKIISGPGKYSIKAKYGDVEITRAVTVKHTVTLKTATVKKSAKSLVLTATLKQGKAPVKYQKVTFKFNGKTYTAKTNKNGVAKVTIKKSVLSNLKVGKTVSYQVTYGKETVKKSAKVVK